jgi:hypothetical protein
LYFQGGFFSLDFLSEILSTLTTLTWVTCFMHSFLLDWIILIFGDGNELWTFSMCTFLIHPVIVPSYSQQVVLKTPHYTVCYNSKDRDRFWSCLNKTGIYSCLRVTLYIVQWRRVSNRLFLRWPRILCSSSGTRRESPQIFYTSVYGIYGVMFFSVVIALLLPFTHS